jgi:hypothetical protein
MELGIIMKRASNHFNHTISIFFGSLPGIDQQRLTTFEGKIVFVSTRWNKNALPCFERFTFAVVSFDLEERPVGEARSMT